MGDIGGFGSLGGCGGIGEKRGMWLESRDLWAAIGGYGALGCCRVFRECFRAIWGI